MKKFVLVILTAVLAGGLLGGGLGAYKIHKSHWDTSMENFEFFEKYRADYSNELAKIASGEAKAPRVAVEEVEHDFGVMELNEHTQLGSHDFKISNIGTDTLKIKEKDKSCFCTSSTLAKHSLSPGESTTCTVTWDGHNAGGDFKQSVTFSCNDPHNPEFFFNIRGLYTAPVVCNPNHLAFNGITGTQPHTQEFHILGFGQGEDGKPFNFEFSDITVSDPEHFELTIEPGTLDERTEFEQSNRVFSNATSLFLGKVTVKPGLSQGAFQEQIRIRTNHPAVPQLELMLDGQVAGSVTISGRKYDKHGSGELIIGTVSSRETTTENFRVDIVDPLLTVSDETVKVLSTRPDWLQVKFDYPDPELQKSMPVKMVPTTVTIPAGSPQENFSGPGLAQTGEIVISIGEEGKAQKVILPVNFSVGP